jgi:peptide/nickel transport system substrate-binding protein
MARLRTLIAACLLAPALMLAGCDRGTAGSGAAAGRADAASAPFGVYPASDYSEQSPGRPGGTLKLSAALDTGSLDVHALSHTNVEWLGRLVFDNLVYLDEKGDVSPWLATSWTVSPDGLTYVLELREGVTFSDGTPFDAEAVLVNLEHMRDPATRSPLAAAYIAPYKDGKVIDRHTVQLNLREPYTPFLNVLAQSWLAMYSPKAIKENPRALAEHPVGSGPYTVERYTRQQGAVFVKRRDYDWAPPLLKHKGPAYLDRIKLEFVPEALVRYNALASGQHDFTIDAPPQNAASIQADERLVFDSRIRSGVPYRAITFNTERFPFDDIRVRRALAHAIDREGIARIMGFGLFKPKGDFLAANTRHFDGSWDGVLNYDPQLAAKLLDEAGWTARDAQGFRTKGGKRLAAEILLAEAISPPALSAAVQSDLKKVGLDLRITQMPLAQLAQRRNAGDYDALAAGVWHTNTPDALYIIHHSAEITGSGRIGQNTSRLRDAPLDDLLARARRSQDPAEAKQLYSKAQQRLTELVPAVPIYDNYSVTAHDRRLRGVLFDTSHNTAIFIAAWLDEGAK